MKHRQIFICVYLDFRYRYLLPTNNFHCIRFIFFISACSFDKNYHNFRDWVQSTMGLPLLWILMSETLLRFCNNTGSTFCIIYLFACKYLLTDSGMMRMSHLKLGTIFQSIKQTILISTKIFCYIHKLPFYRQLLNHINNKTHHVNFCIVYFCHIFHLLTWSRK